MPDLIVFDGVCNLCDRSVQFIIAHDRAGNFQFASMQSDAGARAMREHGVDPASADTFLLIREGIAYRRSEAAWRIAARLDGAWRALSLVRWMPRGLRDFIYDGIARHRLAWFGRRDACLVPTPELRGRFLD